MRVEAGVAMVEGDLTLANATRLLAEGEEAVGNGATTFDLGGVGQLDSSAISLLLSLKRHTAGTGKTLTFRNLPPSLLSLGKLYGIADYF
jgi:phospholipid transport system transporter-binding protein